MGKKRRTGKKEGVLLTILVLFCTFLTGCTLLDIKDGGLGMTNPDYVEPEEESTTSDHTESPDLGEFQKEGTTSWLTEAGKAALVEEQEWLRDYGAAFGASFLGYTPDYSFPGKEYQRAETYPYLDGIPEDHIIEYTGDEWYVIVPAEDGWKISIESCSWNDDFTESRTEDLLWESDDGFPLILQCNLSDLYSNVQVTARKGSREVSWHPYYLTYAGEIEPTDGVQQLLSGSYMPEEGYLYGMEGSWYCDSAKTDAGEPYFYSVTFMTGEDGYPLDMWYYGGLLDGGYPFFLGWQLCIWGSTWGISGILAEHAGWHPKWYDLAGVGWRMPDHSRNGRRSFFLIYERVSGKILFASCSSGWGELRLFQQ